MRLLFSLAVLIALLGFAPRGEAQELPWCAYYDPYTYNCGFYTFQQCLDTISGVGGVCRRNPRAGPDDSRRPERERSRTPGQPGRY